MSAIIHASIPCMELLSDLHDTIKVSVSNKKRWHMAFATIYCSRAFLSRRNQISSNMNQISSEISPAISSLTNLVKEKSLEQLAKLGGIEGISASLNTDLQHGINGDHSEDIASRQEAFGTNTYQKQPTKDGPREGWYDGGSIFVAVFLVISVSAISNFRQNRQFVKLSKVSNNIPVEVVRNGRRQHISIFEIVVGDVVCLKIGDQVPADGLFIDGHSLQVDESSMTGESDHVEIDRSKNPFLFSGTKVADGYAKMLVTSVGMNTFWGAMMSSISRDSDEQTPLQARLSNLTSSIGKVGLTVAFLVLVVLLVRYFTGNTEDENGNQEFNGSKTKVDDVINAVVGIIAAAVTVVVVAIPEGLPLAVTLTLAYSMKRMMADQAMVRKLSACETMGSATTICTDKTGTLTVNQMKVTKFWQGKESIEGTNYTVIASNVLELLCQGIGLNTTGSVYKSKTNLEFAGSPTEKAILSWAVLELNMDMEALKRDCNILHVEAFNSAKKRSGILMKKVEDDTFHVHWKGAAEMILAMCSYYYDLEGNMTALNDQERMIFDQIIQGMAASSLRCIAFAHKQVSEVNHDNKIQENELTLMGFVGLKDPCRPGVKKAVEDCQYAGVNVKMITGDNIFTAKAIATEFDRIRVMARSSPFDKLLMVQCLKNKGHVVAVTGDGTNDAPALKEADIGLSMGIQGTEVAKQSSDIVILDDDFASVATVLRWGRCVYNNIQKFIQFQLTVNVAALAINFVAAVSAGEVPLTAVQLLWELMEKHPVGRTEPLISNVMWRNLLAQALYQIAVLLTLQFRGESILGGIHRNKLFLGITGITVVLQAVMVEFLKNFADTERLNWGQWGVCIVIAAASWPIGFLVKFLPVPERPLFSYFSLKTVLRH
ncbi:Calcium transporting ATPase [Handroanthus impetiginosus]|uniref:Calcium-transporting ATPase n=1 Tax=Handroanthus impetiginosus TaxID=429701 RepID=A0A2G9HX33_9LAMI|nr:Calcium transporting ATPase [Handroanthus impetiginosus]